jgi:hypothetical protein
MYFQRSSHLRNNRGLHLRRVGQNKHGFTVRPQSADRGDLPAGVSNVCEGISLVPVACGHCCEQNASDVPTSASPALCRAFSGMLNHRHVCEQQRQPQPLMGRSPARSLIAAWGKGAMSPSKEAKMLQQPSGVSNRCCVHNV